MISDSGLLFWDHPVYKMRTKYEVTPPSATNFVSHFDIHDGDSRHLLT